MDIDSILNELSRKRNVDVTIISDVANHMTTTIPENSMSLSPKKLYIFLLGDLFHFDEIYRILKENEVEEAILVFRENIDIQMEKAAFELFPFIQIGLFTRGQLKPESNHLIYKEYLTYVNNETIGVKEPSSRIMRARENIKNKLRLYGFIDQSGDTATCYEQMQLNHGDFTREDIPIDPKHFSLWLEDPIQRKFVSIQFSNSDTIDDIQPVPNARNILIITDGYLSSKTDNKRMEWVGEKRYEMYTLESVLVDF